MLRFRCHVPYAVEQHPAAETTIRVLELDRASLDAERERIYDLLCGLLAVLREHPAQEHRQRAGALLLEAARPSAPFSAMARDLLVVEELLPPSPAP